MLPHKSFMKKGNTRPLFSDLTSRRYDASGFILNNVRTTKICHRKDLTKKRAERNSGIGGNGNDGSGIGGALGLFFAKVKQAMGIFDGLRRWIGAKRSILHILISLRMEW